MVYTTALPAGPPSVTLGLRLSVQPAKPAPPTRLLSKQLPKVNVYSAYKIFTTLRAPFPNRISHFKVLALP